ncbi:hypothetical protein V2W45_1335093 [Cenococcum geophilum]
MRIIYKASADQIGVSLHYRTILDIQLDLVLLVEPTNQSSEPVQDLNIGKPNQSKIEPVHLHHWLGDVATDFVRRVKDRKGMCLGDYGKLILHGTFQVQKDVDGRPREEFPGRIRKKLSGGTVSSTLRLCGVVWIKRITGTMSLRRSSGHYDLQIFLGEAAKFKFLAIRFTTDEMMRKWKSQIDAQRQAWKELATLSSPFFRNAGGMPVSDLHAQEYFSSDDDVDEGDDIMALLLEL